MQRLDALWWEAVGPPEGPDDEHEGFVSLGGYSLAAVRLIGSIRDVLGVQLPLTTVLRDNASLAEVRAFVAARAGTTKVLSSAAALAGSDPLASVMAPGQRRIWLLSKLYPESAAYNVVAAVRLRGRLRADALRDALAAVVARHDALRAYVVETDDLEPSLRYETAVAPDLTVRETSAPLTDRLLSDFVREVAGHPVPMDQAPMLRAELLRTSGAEDAEDADACLVLSFHHLVSDLRTLDIVLADLAAAYTALTGGRSPELGPAPAFAAYADEQAGLVGGPDWTADLEYWRGLLSDVPDTPLPFQPAAGRTPSFEGDDRDVRLGAERTRRIEAFTRARGITPAMLFLGCVAVVVAAWTGTSRTVIGMPASRRGHTGEQDLAGFLLETLPIVVETGAQPDLGRLLQHVRERCVDALTHAAPTFDAVVAALGPRPRNTVSPLFQVWFNDLTGAAPAPHFAGSSATLLPVPGFAALFEVNFYLHREAAGYRLQLVRAVDRIEAEVAAELLDQCVRVLDQALADDRLPLGRVDLVTPRSAELRATPTSKPASASVEHAVMAGIGPTATIRTPAGEIGPAELTGMVDGVAGELVAAGVHDGSVVEIQAHRGAGLPVALLAAWRVGAVAALVDGTSPPARLAEAKARVRPAATLLVDPHGSPAVRLEPGSGEALVLANASHVLFTSGSGGSPLPVVVERGALETAWTWYRHAFRPGPSDRTALLAGLGHDPVLRDLLVPIRSGGTLSIPDGPTFADPTALLRFLVRHQITIVHATPPLLELLVAAASAAPGIDLANVRLVLCGGAPLTAGLVRRLRALTPARIVNGYGTTETPQVVACHVVLEHDEDVARLSGWPDEAILPLGSGVAGSELSVRTPGGEPAGVGQLGEVTVTGRVAAGYLGDTGATADPGAAGNGSRFGVAPSGEPMFRTGDLGRLDPWGLVHFVGRQDRQLTVSGFRLEPAEVEAAALRVPGVAQALAGLADTAAGPVLTLNLVPEAGATIDSAAVRKRLQAGLPRHAVPGAIVVLPRLATNANQKVVLSTAETGAAAPTSGSAYAGDATVSWLAAEFQAVLGHRLDPEENFFEAGLSSLNLLHLHGRLAAELAEPPPLTALFAHPNLRALAAHLAGQAGPSRTTDPSPPGRRPDQRARAAQARRDARSRPHVGEGS